MDDAFKALADGNRRQLLDALKHQDGQTLGELSAGLPHLSRFGVMKHLQGLERASLITTRKVGRYKHHYLNVVPIQEIADRWISRFAAPWARGMHDLKSELEGGRDMHARPRHVFTTLIQTTPDGLWDALTNPEITERYFFGLTVTTDWTAGAEITYRRADGAAMITGRILEVTPKSRIAYSFEGDLGEDGAREPDSRVTFEIEQIGAACKLTLVHDEFPSENTTFRNVGGGWPTVVSGLKTWLETGKPLILDASPCPSESRGQIS